jgi:hypothetical protein
VTADILDRPVFLVSSPRSGSTLLFQTLAQSPGLATIGGESHGLIEGMPELHPAARGWQSNRLTAADATPATVAELSRRFRATLRARDGSPAAPPMRMLEKTPKNSLRVPFFAAAWSDATFVYLYRDARQTLSSMIEAWQSGRFRTYPRLPEWSGLPWSLLLVPGWRALCGRPLEEIVAHQWAATTDMLLSDLAKLPPEQVIAADYADFLAQPPATIAEICQKLGVAWDRPIGDRLPLSRTTVSAPHPDKWRANAAAIDRVWPIVEQADARARAFHQSRREEQQWRQ